MILTHQRKRAPFSSSGPMPDRALALVELGRQLQSQHYHFVTPSPQTIARVNACRSNERAKQLTDVFGWNRPFDVPLLAPTMLSLMQDAEILEQRADGFRSAVRASTMGEQLFFHSSFPTTSPDAVLFGPDSYRFVRQLHIDIPALSGRVTRAVDIGCGAGPGAVALAQLCPDAAVHALDINPAALHLTAVNACLARLPNITLCYSDLLDDVEGTFDLIVSNPPYLVDADQRAYRHGGGRLGATVPLALIDAALPRLALGGTSLVYTASAIIDGFDHLRNAIANRLTGSGLRWSYDEIDPDVLGDELATPPYLGADRIAAVWLKVTKPALPKVYW